MEYFRPRAIALKMKRGGDYNVDDEWREQE